MFIIFGTNSSDDFIRNKNNSCKCPHCNNTVNYKVISKNDNFTLFFIPVVPYNKKYYELCPICNHGNEITKDMAFNYND